MGPTTVMRSFTGLCRVLFIIIAAFREGRTFDAKQRSACASPATSPRAHIAHCPSPRLGPPRFGEGLATDTCCLPSPRMHRCFLEARRGSCEASRKQMGARARAGDDHDARQRRGGQRKKSLISQRVGGGRKSARSGGEASFRGKAPAPSREGWRPAGKLRGSAREGKDERSPRNSELRGRRSWKGQTRSFVGKRPVMGMNSTGM